MTTGPQGDVELLRSEALLLNADAAVRDAVLADIEPVSHTLSYAVSLLSCLSHSGVDQLVLVMGYRIFIMQHSIPLCTTLHPLLHSD